MRSLSLLVWVVIVPVAFGQSSKSYRLPSVDLKQRIIWGSEAEGGGFTLAFGGQDQQGTEGCAPTRLKVDGEWIDLRDELRKTQPYRHEFELLRSARNLVKEVIADARSSWLGARDLPTTRLKATATTLAGLKFRETDERLLRSVTKFRKALAEWESISVIEPATIAKMVEVQRQLERAMESLDVEPPGRAYAALVYEPKSRLFILVGGDHGDYLVNDVWTFDPKARRWEPRWPKTAPPPRAKHTLKANGDGTMTLSGGYTYTSNTDYVGGQYRDINDGEWVYDIAANTWKGSHEGVPPDARTYRTGPFDPEYFLQVPQPDPKAFAQFIETMPANRWVKTNPPRLPQMNRDWGSAVLAPPNQLLRYAGGHSAHGGTDVLHYHLTTNRWELTNPVEFPLGQTYVNTEYPDGFNFNQRPWITGHTYQNYGFDVASKRMLFLGRERHAFPYDPVVGDWTGERFDKPKDLVYDSCFYTLTLTPVGDGLVCWTAAGKLYRYESKQWKPIILSGDKLPGAVVDNSTLTYDRKRDRLLFFVKGYGDKVSYSGQVHTVDLKSGRVQALSPKGMKGAGAIPYLCQIRYDPKHDLCFVGGRLPDGRTPAFDGAANRWVSLQIGGDDPNGPKGRNVSLGLVYDETRSRFWAVDAKSQVFVLKLVPDEADIRGLSDE